MKSAPFAFPACYPPRTTPAAAIIAPAFLAASGTFWMNHAVMLLDLRTARLDNDGIEIT
jgi:hypothetical protein